MGLGFKGLGFGVLGFKGLEFRVLWFQGLGFRAESVLWVPSKGLGLRIRVFESSGCRV